MKINTRNKIEASFSMASMTDVIFLLLIFLLITSHNKPKALPVNLPISSNKKIATSHINVIITAKLEYYVEGHAVSFNQLEKVLHTRLAQTSNKIVLLHMDKQLSIAHMVKVADIITTLGATVSLATELDKKP
jgi:biopolymer transport protein ExbD